MLTELSVTIVRAGDHLEIRQDGLMVAKREAIQNIVAYMKPAQETNGNHDLDSTIEQLTNLDSLLSELSTRMSHLNDLVQEGDVSKIRAYLSQINDVVNNISDLTT